MIDQYSSTLRAQGDNTLQKYKGLTITIDLKQTQTPNFHVTIGMLDAQFSINDATKLGGSLGNMDDRNVSKWYRRSNFSTDLMAVWNENYTKEYTMYKPKKTTRE